mmetsp:Transcript_14793/g.45164  ORF Transcript_14793/g.45164 Transcript_14793/m.45164 type:complete len:653 (+) Transcript_14793:1645-3603(+)
MALSNSASISLTSGCKPTLRTHSSVGSKPSGSAKASLAPTSPSPTMRPNWSSSTPTRAASWHSSTRSAPFPRAPMRGTSPRCTSRSMATICTRSPVAARAPRYTAANRVASTSTTSFSSSCATTQARCSTLLGAGSKRTAARCTKISRSYWPRLPARSWRLSLLSAPHRMRPSGLPLALRTGPPCARCPRQWRQHRSITFAASSPTCSSAQIASMDKWSRASCVTLALRLSWRSSALGTQSRTRTPTSSGATAASPSISQRSSPKRRPIQWPAAQESSATPKSSLVTRRRRSRGSTRFSPRWAQPKSGCAPKCSTCSRSRVAPSRDARQPPVSGSHAASRHVASSWLRFGTPLPSLLCASAYQRRTSRAPRRLSTRCTPSGRSPKLLLRRCPRSSSRAVRWLPCGPKLRSSHKKSKTSRIAWCSAGSPATAMRAVGKRTIPMAVAPTGMPMATRMMANGPGDPRRARAPSRGLRAKSMTASGPMTSCTAKAPTPLPTAQLTPAPTATVCVMAVARGSTRMVATTLASGRMVKSTARASIATPRAAWSTTASGSTTVSMARVLSISRTAVSTRASFSKASVMARASTPRRRVRSCLRANGVTTSLSPTRRRPPNLHLPPTSTRRAPPSARKLASPSSSRRLPHVVVARLWPVE